MFSSYVKRFVVTMVLMNACCAYSMDIFEAAEQGDVEKVSRILKAHPQVVNAKHVSRKTPLHLAAQHGHVPVVRLLLSKGADVDAKTTKCDMTPLYVAISGKGDYKTVGLLVQHGADVNAQIKRWGRFGSVLVTPLKEAITGGKVKLALFLISYGAKDQIGEYDLLDRSMREWPGYNWRASKIKFDCARKEFLMNTFALPEDLAKLILFY